MCGTHWLVLEGDEVFFWFLWVFIGVPDSLNSIPARSRQGRLIHWYLGVNRWTDRQTDPHSRTQQTHSLLTVERPRLEPIQRVGLLRLLLSKSPLLLEDGGGQDECPHLPPSCGSHRGKSDDCSDKVLFAGLEHVNDVLSHQVCVLLTEALCGWEGDSRR